MPTFIDESGDTGHAVHSALFFRLAAVWVPTQEDAEAFRAEIQKLRRDLGLSQAYEFKFARTGPHPDRRKGFLQAALRSPFRFTVAALDKGKGKWKKADRSAIHSACVASLADALRPAYLAEEARRADAGHDRPLNELVVVDDNEDRKFLDVIKLKFRELRSTRRPGAPLVGKVKFRGSGPDELLQLADMVCGAVGSHLDGQSDWYEMIASRDLGITRIP